ncbi:MAG: hypothetical protein GY938_13500 [Ketobacter sp.]|nr:hypothetical protein [Ketobacter sp.]
MNRNHYITRLFVTHLEDLVEFETPILSSLMDYPISPCQALEVEHCEQLEDFRTCRHCEKNYYLTQDQKCKKMPFPRIDNCEIYTSYQNCVRCTQGYLLASEKECKEVTPIENCSEYDGTSSANICVLCMSDYFVSGNSCVLRENSQTIENCSEFRTHFDDCSVCQNGFVITNDHLKCLSELPECLQYGFSSVSSTTHSCIRCALGSYYDSAGASCSVGSVENCEEYQLS